MYLRLWYVAEMINFKNSATMALVCSIFFITAAGWPPRPHKILCSGYNTFLPPSKGDPPSSVVGDIPDGRGRPLCAHYATPLGPAKLPQSLVSKNLWFTTTNIYVYNDQTTLGVYKDVTGGRSVTATGKCKNSRAIWPICVVSVHCGDL
jgi:hypothetical protein